MSARRCELFHSFARVVAISTTILALPGGVVTPNGAVGQPGPVGATGPAGPAGLNLEVFLHNNNPLASGSIDLYAV